MDKALNASKKIVKVSDGADKTYRVLKKYVLPVACVAFAAFAYAAYDIDLGDEMKKK